MRCWIQIASGCTWVYPCLLWVRSWPGEHKGGLCVCVCTVSSGTSNGAMLQNVALPNSFREKVKALHLLALIVAVANTGIEIKAQNLQVFMPAVWGKEDAWLWCPSLLQCQWIYLGISHLLIALGQQNELGGKVVKDTFKGSDWMRMWSWWISSVA